MLCRTYGAHDFSLRFPALTDWAKLWRACGASGEKKLEVVAGPGGS